MSAAVRKSSMQMIALTLCVAIAALAVPISATQDNISNHQIDYTMSINWQQVAYWGAVGAVVKGTVMLGVVALVCVPTSAPLVVKAAVVVGTALVASGSLGVGVIARPSF